MSHGSDDRQFIYDAVRKVARVTGETAGEPTRLELVERHDDDSFTARVVNVGGVLRLSEADFAFTADTVEVRLPPLRFKMDPIYLKKLRAYTRGNIPTPDVPGDSLP